MDEIVVGLIRRAHGLTGEFHVSEQTDSPAEVFEPGRVFRVPEPPRGQPRRLTLESARPHGGGWLLRFREVKDRGAAEAYAGRELTLRREELRPLEEGEFFLHELVGFDVVLASDGSRVGCVREVYDASGRWLLAVDRAGRETMLPLERPVVSRVDRAERRIEIEPPAGLLEL